MIIKCPTCSQGYDTTGYPDNYKFACSCGTIIDVAALQQQMTGAAEPYVHPPPPQPLPMESSPDSTMKTSPPAVAMDQLIPGMNQDDVDLIAREAEPTAVTRSPYVAATNTAQYSASSEDASSQAYALHPSTAGMPSNVSTDAYSSPASMNSQGAEVLGASNEQLSPTPASWNDLPDTGGPSGTLPIDDADRTEPRAIWAIIFAFFVVLGPLVWLLAARARQQIRLAPNIFRGRQLALIGILLGITQTLALGGVLYLAFAQPNIHPLIQRTALALGTVQPRTTIDSFKKRSEDPSTLSMSLAQSLLKQRIQLHNAKAKVPALAYLEQGTNPYHAYGHWYDAKRKASRKGVFFHSVRGHWHLAHVVTAYQEETRVSAEGPSKLTDALARQLIKKFWQLRGRFTGTHIHQLYVVQVPGRAAASAYWKLQKQKAGKPLQAWKIESQFRRSIGGKWFLVRYAVRVPKDEEYQFSATSEPRLTTGIAKTLLAQAYKLQKQSFQPRSMTIVQGPKAVEGWLLWQNGRRTPPQRSLFRYSTAQKWHLARTLVAPAIEVAYQIKGTPRLSQGLARKLLNQYLKKQRKGLQVQHLYVYQTKGKNTAWVRWMAQASRKQKLGTPPQKPQQSVFHYTSEGVWNLTLLNQSPVPEVQFHQKGGKTLNTTIAKKLLRQYWKDKSWKSNSRRFSGAKIQDMYIYQNPNSSKAWAHWVISNNDTSTPLRSSFYYSEDGSWFLGIYDLGKGYSLQHQMSGPKQLTVEKTLPLLRKYLKLKYKDTRVVVRDFYLVQPSGQYRAYVRWIWQSGVKARVVFSMLHRSNENRWYLSVPELPNPPSL